ncbi:MAG: PD-(D/E)XK nuclease family protein [Nanoarchaeota archaeon]
MDNKFDLNKIKWVKGWRNLPEAYYRIKTPSVTTIINDMIPDPGIDKWIEDVGKEVADKITKAAHDKGKSVHIFIEEFLKMLKESNDPSKALKHTQIESPKILESEGIPEDKIIKGRDIFYNFYDSEYAISLKDFIGIELPIYSPFLFFRGLADIVYKRLGLSVSDFKTSSKTIEKGSIKEKKYKLQLGGYALALDHMYKDKNIVTNYASIISFSTKSNIIQTIECEGKELEEKKKEFETITKEWHKNNKQSFLIEN